ncbi:hypothetical protein HHL22_09810 [Hymenobacter sp. RP-2-7]|uniref:SH3 domain-containing protein n=1 Tax=Hymenobacter polaris TaxID=2682546 RepID=A0A7Y0ADR7_9BACT|nr:hypothetical protein [Hymenobacter polaris]NML65498.1 hypothetical protein [Hymenobacter polaris]
MRFYLPLLALAVLGCTANTNPNDTPLGTAPAAPAPAMPATPAVADSNQPASARNTVAAPQGVAWPMPFAPAAGLGCTRVAKRAVTIRMRPGAGAAQFGQLAVGDKVRLAARTADGWVGFNPGTAQAANVGIFRLRWVRASEAFAPSDSCARLPVVQAPPPLCCLLMAARATPVHPHPAPSTARLSIIPAGSYAQVVKTAVGPGKWTEVLVPGSTAHGYVAPGDVNFSGDCQ